LVSADATGLSVLPPDVLGGVAGVAGVAGTAGLSAVGGIAGVAGVAGVAPAVLLSETPGVGWSVGTLGFSVDGLAGTAGTAGVADFSSPVGIAGVAGVAIVTGIVGVVGLPLCETSPPPVLPSSAFALRPNAIFNATITANHLVFIAAASYCYFAARFLSHTHRVVMEVRVQVAYHPSVFAVTR
jgi:hypothetical protein